MVIFIIDDDEFSLFLTETLLHLKDASLQVKTFLSAPEALEELLSGRGGLPDLIFLDLNMPLMSGWEFLEALSPRAAELRQQCRIYILTSSVDASDLETAREFPLVSDFLYKPIEAGSIDQILSHA